MKKQNIMMAVMVAGLVAGAQSFANGTEKKADTTTTTETHKGDSNACGGKDGCGGKKTVKKKVTEEKTTEKTPEQKH